MIAYIKGELVILEEDRVIVDVGGVGYGIYMPGRAMSALPPITCWMKDRAIIGSSAKNE